jgi:hypothetical protein
MPGMSATDDHRNAAADQIRKHADLLASSHAAALEKVCEHALQGGTFGIRVTAHGPKVDPTVPFGHIYYDQYAWNTP